MRRYPVVGGAAAWRLPLLTGLLALAGLALDTRALAAIVIVVGWAGHRLWRSVVVEISPDGLARGFALDGAFVGPTLSLPWSSVVAVETGWMAPDDHRALETVVRGRDGTTIRISTTMGLPRYRACLAEIVRRAPSADRVGLTDATLASEPPARPEMLTAVWMAGGLGLVLATLVGLGYLLAQGRSSLARYLDESAPPAHLLSECRPAVRIDDGPPSPPCPAALTEPGNRW
jgi:hypothetical protein